MNLAPGSYSLVIAHDVPFDQKCVSLVSYLANTYASLKTHLQSFTFCEVFPGSPWKN